MLLLRSQLLTLHIAVVEVGRMIFKNRYALLSTVPCTNEIYTEEQTEKALTQLVNVNSKLKQDVDVLEVYFSLDELHVLHDCLITVTYVFQDNMRFTKVLETIKEEVINVMTQQ